MAEHTLKNDIRRFFVKHVFFPIGGIFFRGYCSKKTGVLPVELVYRKRSEEDDFCSFENIPDHLTRYTILLEDRQFYRHMGADLRAVLRCCYYNLKAGHMKYGASTITQQLCKNLYFGFRGTLERKIRELFISFYIESVLSKEQILELYLNTVYFGNGRYGVTDASRYYFDAEPSELSINQAFSLICMLPFPGIKNPLVFPDEFCSFKERKASHLYRIRALSSEEYEMIEADSGIPDKALRKPEEINRWYSEHVPWFNERFGPFPEVREEEKIIICTVYGESRNASDNTQKAVAHVIMNRVGFREWRKYKSAEEIIKNTGFDAYGMELYNKAEEYLRNRNGLEDEIERVIRNVIPVIRGQEKDFTGKCVMFYSPARQVINSLKRGRIHDLRPDWNFDILERARLKGCRGDYAFFRYKNDAKK